MNHYSDLYFTVYLTENEHDIFEKELSERCHKLDLTLNYYRKFKSGHVPCWRECKVSGHVNNLIKFGYNQHLHNYFSIKKAMIAIAQDVQHKLPGKTSEELVEATEDRLYEYLDKEEIIVFRKMINRCLELYFKYGVWSELT